MTDLRLIRTSERNDFKRCPWLWNETWIKGLSPVRVPTWAWFGTAIHKGLEVRYPPGKKRGSRTDTIDAFVESLEGETRKIWTDAEAAHLKPGEVLTEEEVVDGKTLGIAMLNGYIDHFGKDKKWNVIHGEQSFQIDVPDPDDNTKVIAVYAGTWDLLVWDEEEKCFKIVDHKTRRSFPKNWDFYTINDQAGSYLWVAPEVLRHMGIFGKKDVIEYLIFNALRKAMPPDPTKLDAKGVKRNLPKKDDFVNALYTYGRREKVEINIPARITIAGLQEMADARGIKVWGPPSAVQPQPLFHREEVERALVERVKQGQRVQEEARWMNLILSGERKPFKTPTEDCVRCKIFEYCQADEYNYDEGQEIAATILKFRDPYVDHRQAFADGGVEIKIKEK